MRTGRGRRASGPFRMSRPDTRDCPGLTTMRTDGIGIARASNRHLSRAGPGHKLRAARMPFIRGVAMKRIFASLTIFMLGGASALAANETVTVDFALNGGAPTYRASGFIYGISQ